LALVLASAWLLWLAETQPRNNWPWPRDYKISLGHWRLPRPWLQPRPWPRLRPRFCGLGLRHVVTNNVLVTITLAAGLASVSTLASSSAVYSPRTGHLCPCTHTVKTAEYTVHGRVYGTFTAVSTTRLQPVYTTVHGRVGAVTRPCTRPFSGHRRTMYTARTQYVHIYRRPCKRAVNMAVFMARTRS